MLCRNSHRRGGVARRLVAALGVSVALAACGSAAPRATSTSAPTSSSSSASTASTSASTTAAPTTTESTRPLTLRLYFMRGDKIGVASRSVSSTTAVATAALTALLAGPAQADTAAGLTTSIPAGTRLLGVSIADGTATVDLSGTFASGGGSLSMVARLAQVTYTATQFPTVSRVVFRLDGRAVTVFGGEGIILDHPSTRSDFESVTPAILVEAPTPGTVLGAQVRMWGTANVFEAVFHMQITASNGTVVVDRAVQATSGTGTRGTFDVTVATATAPTGNATLTVYDLSAKDGSRQDVVSIPVHFG